MMNQLLPAWLDLWHLAEWCVAVFAIAMIIGGIFAFLDQLFPGAPASSTRSKEPVGSGRVLSEPNRGESAIHLVTIRLARRWDDPAPKGFNGSPIINIDQRRRELETAARIPADNGKVH